ncbi:MAG: hypothetical protein AAF656_01875, partial [Planctomycetota bacterium]
GHDITAAKVHQITAPPDMETAEHNARNLEPVTHTCDPTNTWTFPAASVSAVELKMTRKRP